MSRDPERIRYRAGERVPRSGIYQVVHRDHRAAHENSFIEGEIFPDCKHCGNNVEFEFLQGRTGKRDAGPKLS